MLRGRLKSPSSFGTEICSITNQSGIHSRLSLTPFFHRPGVFWPGAPLKQSFSWIYGYWIYMDIGIWMDIIWQSATKCSVYSPGCPFAFQEPKPYFFKTQWILLRSLSPRLFMSAPLKRGPAQQMPLLKGNSLNIYNGYCGVLQSMTRSSSSYKKAESGLYSLEQQGRLW